MLWHLVWLVYYFLKKLDAICKVIHLNWFSPGTISTREFGAIRGVRNDSQKNNMTAWPTNVLPFVTLHGGASSFVYGAAGGAGRSQNKITVRLTAWQAVSRKEPSLKD